MKTIYHNGHQIDAPGSSITGLEQVRYDGAIVSSKRSILGATHEFEATEDEQTVSYKVVIGTKWTGLASCTVFRNGELLFSDC